jgi:hypothetical protein
LWDILKKSANYWRSNLTALVNAATDYGAPDDLDGEQLIEYCKVYERDWTDGGPLRVDDEEQILHIMASGGSSSRILKEHVARAFCRLVIQDMHRKQIEVNLHVV